MITVPCSCEGVQLTRCLLEIQFRGEETVLVTPLVEEGKAVDLVDLDFSKAFGTNSYTILEKLTAHGLDGCTVSWVKTWLDG